MKPLSPERRRAVGFAVCATLLATLPDLVMLPLRQAHRLSDPPYFMGTGLCIGLSIACLIAAMVTLTKSKCSGATD